MVQKKATTFTHNNFRAVGRINKVALNCSETLFCAYINGFARTQNVYSVALSITNIMCIAPFDAHFINWLNWLRRYDYSDPNLTTDYIKTLNGRSRTMTISSYEQSQGHDQRRTSKLTSVFRFQFRQFCDICLLYAVNCTAMPFEMLLAIDIFENFRYKWLNKEIFTMYHSVKFCILLPINFWIILQEPRNHAAQAVTRNCRIGQLFLWTMHGWWCVVLRFSCWFWWCYTLCP